MNIVVGLIPAVGWGFQPILSQKTGAKPINQLIGTTLACFIVGCFIFVTLVLSLGGGINYFEWSTFTFNFIKGILWGCGAVCIFIIFKYLGVAKTGPLSTGVQLIYTTIIGIAMFGDNRNTQVPYQGVLVCIAGLLIAIVGMVLVSWKPKSKNTKKELQSHKLTKQQILFISALFLIVMIGNGSFFVFSNLPAYIAGHGDLILGTDKLCVTMKLWNGIAIGNTSGHAPSLATNTYNLICMFPLGIGMIVGAICQGTFMWIYPAIRKNNRISWKTANSNCAFIQSSTYASITAGISFSIASLALLYSTNANGVANASLLGQINVVVLSVFGLLIFKEKKAKEEYITLFVGLGLVTIGCILPALNPQFFPALKN